MIKQTEIYTEDNEALVPPPPLITSLEASKHLDCLINYIHQSEDFTEANHFMLNNLSSRINSIREKNKTQANISNYLASIHI